MSLLWDGSYLEKSHLYALCGSRDTIIIVFPPSYGPRLVTGNQVSEVNESRTIVSRKPHNA